MGTVVIVQSSLSVVEFKVIASVTPNRSASEPSPILNEVSPEVAPNAVKTRVSVPMTTQPAGIKDVAVRVAAAAAATVVDAEVNRVNWPLVDRWILKDSVASGNNNWSEPEVL